MKPIGLIRKIANSTVAVVAAVLLLAFCAAEAMADTFTATVPAGTEVTMLDTFSVVPVNITNNGPSRDIRRVTFDANTSMYTISAATVPPAGWCVSSVSSSSITFELLQADGDCDDDSRPSEIAPGQSLTFNITVEPLSAASDVAGDTFSNIRVRTQTPFSLSGSLPTWTRRSLEADLSATPPAVGVGSTVMLEMYVVNNSTSSHSSITSTPSPPTPSAGIVSFAGGPFYARTVLSANITATDAVITIDTTADFPSSGTIQIEAEKICYTGKTATTLTGATRGCLSTTAAAHSSGVDVFGATAFSLASGEGGTIIWQYTATATGTVTFSARSINATGTARSMSVTSNQVYIGSFTAILTVAPDSVTSGTNVTVQMIVTNNSAATITSITPSVPAGCAGGATETFVSGPSPASIPTLAPGSSGSFAWTYSITGSNGAAYCLSALATATGPLVTNTATSNTGYISSYTATATPSTVQSGATNQTISWSVYNGGTCSIREVRLTTPASGGRWTCSATTPPAGWTSSCATTVRFRSSGGGWDIAPGSSRNFAITFSTTETVTTDKVVSFPVRVRLSGCGGTWHSASSSVTVTPYVMALAYSPAGPIYADGSSFYTLTATLASGAVPESGRTVSFTTTAGTLNPTTAVTDSNGVATVMLVSPVSLVNTTATVTASYLSVSASTVVNFLGWTKANIQYWGGLAPLSVNCGDAYTFTMNVKNLSLTSSMTLGTGSYFAFNDSSAGGSAVLMAYLNASTPVAPNVTVSLSFGSATSSGGGGGVVIPTDFTPGSYEPLQNSSPPPASGLFLTDGGANDQYRSVGATVTVGGTCGAAGGVRVIEWHELR